MAEMKSNQITKYIPFILGIPVLVFLFNTALHNGDFKVFLEAAKLIAAGKNPYHLWIFISEGHYAFYFNSPLWATLLIPFTHLPNFVTNIIWLLANVYFLYRIWILLTRYFAFYSLTKRQINWLLFLSILLCARFILYNFEMIQMTVFLLWGSLESLHLFRNKKFIAGGALLAIIINIKILPIVLIPYLIYRKEMKGSLSTLAFSIIFLLLPGLILGWSTNVFLLSEWWAVINPNNPEHLLETDLGLHSLTALLPSLLMKTKGVLPFTRNIFNFSFETTVYILNVIRAGLIILSFYFLKWPPFKPAKSLLNEIYELSYIFLLIPLIFPHQQKYAFFLIYPALFYISYFIIVNFQSSSRRIDTSKYYGILILLMISFLLMTVSSDGIIGIHFNQITQHYKTITYGGVFLIIILILSPPRYVEQ
jgi:hypothetical protein